MLKYYRYSCSAIRWAVHFQFSSNFCLKLNILPIKHSTYHYIHIYFRYLAATGVLGEGLGKGGLGGGRKGRVGGDCWRRKHISLRNTTLKLLFDFATQIFNRWLLVPLCQRCQIQCHVIQVGYVIFTKQIYRRLNVEEWTWPIRTWSVLIRICNVFQEHLTDLNHVHLLRDDWLS